LRTKLIGRGWAFPLHFDANRKIALTDETNEIEQAIQIILSTAQGERVMLPLFGSRLHELVFAPNHAQTAALAMRYVQEALTRWEPRIDVLEVSVDPRFSASDGYLSIEIQYLIKATHDLRSLVYPFYLTPEERLRLAPSGVSHVV